VVVATRERYFVALGDGEVVALAVDDGFAVVEADAAGDEDAPADADAAGDAAGDAGGE
jgi:hypothetical protein